MTTDLQKETYNSIMGLFDGNEKFLDEVEKMGGEVQPYIPEINRLLLEIEDNAEILVDNFLKYMKSGKALSGVEKLKMENAQKSINLAYKRFMELQE